MRMISKRIGYGILVAVLFMLNACSSVQTVEKSSLHHGQTKTDAKAALERHQQVDDVTFRSSTVPDVVGDPISLYKGERLPRVFKANYEMRVSRATSLPELAQRITRLSGIPVIISDDIKDVKPFSFPFKGNLVFLMDVLSSRAKAGWEYKGGVINMHRYTTEVYYLHSLPGSAEYTHELSSTSTGEGETDGGGTDTKGGSSSKVTAKADLWKSVQSTIESMLSKDGHVVVNEASGAIAVTDTAAVHRRVNAYIEGENRRLHRQVVVDVQVLAYQSKDSAEHGVNWDMIYKNSNFGVSLVNNILSSQNAGNLSFQVIDGGWAGSSAVLSALDAVGHIALVTSAPVTTISNQTANLIVADEQSYVSEIKSNLVANAGTSQEVKQDVVSTGLGLSLTPHVLTDRRLVLQMEVNLTALQGFDETVVGNPLNGVTLKSPNQTRRSFMQRVLLNSGQTLVLSGFENNLSLLNKAGIFGRGAWMAGGQRKAEYSDTTLVLLVTPKIINEGIE